MFDRWKHFLFSRRFVKLFPIAFSHNTPHNTEIHLSFFFSFSFSFFFFLFLSVSFFFFFSPSILNFSSSKKLPPNTIVHNHAHQINTMLPPQPPNPAIKWKPTQLPNKPENKTQPPNPIQQLTTVPKPNHYQLTAIA